MNRKVIAKKYARALYNVAAKNLILKETASNISYMVQVINTIPEFRQLLQTQQVSKHIKLSIIKNILKGNITSTEIVLIEDILENSNILILSDMLKIFEHLIESDSNMVNVTITTAKNLLDSEIEHIKSIIESRLKKKVEVYIETDISLIGGIKLRVGNTVIDNSISSRLGILKNKLNQA